MREKSMIAAGLAIICFAQISFAGSLNVAPMVINADVARGKKVSGHFQIANTGKQKITVEISKEMKMSFPTQAVKNNDWLKLKQNKVTLKPGAKKNIDYTVSAGKKDLGEAMAIIFVNEQDANASIMTRTGVVLYAKIKGTEVMDAEIESIKMKKDGLGQVMVDLMIHNRSNVYICPRGKVFINDPSGARVDDVDIPYNTLILPGQSRDIPMYLSKGKTYASNCNLEAVVDYSRGNKKILARKEVSFTAD